LTVAFNAIAFPITALGFLLGGVIQMAGDLISDQPFIYIKGNAPESWNENKHTLFTLNVCMYWGLLPMLFGGVSPARNRLDPLERLIRAQNPDIVVLQEMSSSSGKRLAARLNDKYAHFFTHIGGSGTWINSGTIGAELFVASKAPIVSVKFVPYEDANAARKIGFFCIETPSSWVITAHFPDQTDETWQTHRNLLTQIANTIDELKMTTGKPCVLLGDLNIRRTGQPNDEYAQSGISSYFYDPRTEQYPEFSADNATCTNVLVPRMFGQPDPVENPYETDDYVLIDKGSKDLYHIDVEMGKETYDLDHPDQAMTDHRYYKATVYRKDPV
jgi:endonuclease/exonuclease/phosphatase family metal-dependent hydrolase